MNEILRVLESRIGRGEDVSRGGKSFDRVL